LGETNTAKKKQSYTLPRGVWELLLTINERTKCQDNTWENSTISLSEGEVEINEVIVSNFNRKNDCQLKEHDQQGCIKTSAFPSLPS